MSDLKDKILYALSEQPNLTTEQIVKLTDAKLDTAQKILKRMWEKKLVVPKALPNSRLSGRMYSWRRTDLKTEALREQNYKHDLKINDIYVALRKAGIPMEWEPKSDQKGGFRFDARLSAFGKTFYFEVETGTHGIKAIEEKIDAYINLKYRCYVIFTVQDYRPNPFEEVTKTAKDFGYEILNVISEKGRRHQFTVTPHAVFTASPLNPVLVSHTGEAFTLETIE